MGTAEILIILAIGSVLLGGPLIALILAIIALRRTRRIAELTRRVTQLEARLGAASSPTAAETTRHDAAEVLVAEVVSSAISPESATEVMSPAAAPQVSRSEREPLGWETFIGQKAFGWLAVLLFVFGAAFFLRYAYQNNWIGPVGRVALGELVGAALVFAGWRYYRQGFRRFSAMLSAAGIVGLYLATYSAFGFYRLLSQQHAGAFLAVLVIESMIVAVVYRSTMVALVAVVGGLLTPVLMHSDHDSYSAFFTYLAVLNAGVVVSLLLRSWVAVGSVAFLGTHGLYWMWYSENYHPEKLAWALGFQGVVWGLFLAHSILARTRQPTAGWEELTRFVLNAILSFAAFYVLTRDDYRVWLGSAAVGMATLYALVGRILLSRRPEDNRLLLTAMATVVGFLAWSFPIQADARWVALGWAAMGGALWWFGQRVAAPLLRIMAGVLTALAVGRLLGFDLPTYTRDPFIPVFNGFALPSLGVAACMLAAVLATGPFLCRLSRLEKILVAAAGVSGVLLIWLVLSFECYGYFDAQSIGTMDAQTWRWRGQLALTVFWTVYASILLVLGFRLQRVRLRWLAIVLYGATVAKLFVVDMANVQQLYRILAFFVLAVVLGLVAGLPAIQIEWIMSNTFAATVTAWCLTWIGIALSSAAGQDNALLPQVAPSDSAAGQPGASATAAPDSGPDGPAESAAPELQARWEYFVPVPLPSLTNQAPNDPTAAGTSPLVDLILGPSVLAHARLDLADLRLYDAAGQPVPYALRYLRPQTERDRVPGEEFNRSEPNDGPSELTLDLKRDDIQHNEIEIVTNGEDFRRSVEADGSDDGKTWRRLAAGQLIRFAHGDQKINLQSVTYPASRFRYVRVRVSPDPGRQVPDGVKDEFSITQVNVLRYVEVPGENLTLTGGLGQRAPVRTYGAAGSSWLIDLGGPRIPCERLDVEITDAEFARDVLVEFESIDELRSRPVFNMVSLVGQPLWQRRLGEPIRPIVTEFSEVQTGRLKLSVTDHRNPPLTIRSVKFSAAARQIVFARPAGEAAELRLYFGNPEAAPPNYDFARNLPAKLGSPPVRVLLGEMQRNPDFVPPPLPFTERFPWLIYVVLGSVTLVLAVVIVSLSRTALAMHDASQNSVDQEQATSAG